MATMRPVLVILLLALLGIYSCDDDSPTGGGGVTIHDPFPNAVGMLWKYQVYDSLTQTTDTVWVSVTDSALTRCGYTRYSWRMYWTTRDSVVDRYALIWVDSAMVDIIVDSPQEPELLERFVFPLEEGATWNGPSIYDTCRVTEIGTIAVPAGTFSNSALVEHAWNLDFEGGGNWTETWLAPNVGIAYRHEYQAYSDGTTITVLENRVWRLIEYDLSTFALQQFPNTIGTQWVYEVLDMGYIDFDTVRVDTVTVTIVDRISILGPDSLMVWEFLGIEYADTSFIGTLENIVTVYADTSQSQPSPAWSYEFPMTVGKHWGIDTFAPIPIVSDKCSVITPAGNFQTTFAYFASGGMPGSWMVRDWLAPRVGVVKRVYYPYTGGFLVGPQEWTLLSFDLAQ